MILVLELTPNKKDSEDLAIHIHIGSDLLSKENNGCFAAFKFKQDWDTLEVWFDIGCETYSLMQTSLSWKSHKISLSQTDNKTETTFMTSS